MVRSTLFDREYLVAKVDAGWYSSLRGEHDASALPMLDMSGLFDQYASPPIVLIPSTRRQIRAKSFRPTLEHEFVHINQIMLDQHPLTGDVDHNSDPVQIMVSFVKLEFEAYFIEHCSFPEQVTLPHGFDQYRFSIFQAFTQSLQKVVELALLGQLQATTLRRWFAETPKRLVQEFVRADLRETEANWCIEVFPGFVSAAKGLLLRSIGEPSAGAIEALEDYERTHKR